MLSQLRRDKKSVNKRTGEGYYTVKKKTVLLLRKLFLFNRYKRIRLPLDINKIHN